MKLTFDNNRMIEISVYSPGTLRLTVTASLGEGSTVVYLDQADARVLAMALKESASQLRSKR